MQGRRSVAAQRVTARGTRRERASLAEETPVRVRLGAREVARLNATPVALDELALGHLALAGLLRRREEVGSVRVRATAEGLVVQVSARRRTARPPRPALPQCALERAQVHALMNALRVQGKLYLGGGGVHTSALATPERIVLLAEDVGKVNTLDRLAGKAFLQGVDTRGLFLLTTGRLTTAMVQRGLAMGCPWLLSHSAPTAAGLALAKRAGAGVVGYARAQAFVRYAVPRRPPSVRAHRQKA